MLYHVMKSLCVQFVNYFFSAPFSPIWELEIVDYAFYFMKQVLFIQICVKSVTSTGYSKNKPIYYKYSELMS